MLAINQSINQSISQSATSRGHSLLQNCPDTLDKSTVKNVPGTVVVLSAIVELGISTNEPSIDRPLKDLLCAVHCRMANQITSFYSTAVCNVDRAMVIPGIIIC